MRRLVLFLISVRVLGAMWVFVDTLNVRRCPSLDCDVLTRLHFGDLVRPIETVFKEGYDWVKTDIGWVAMQFLDEVPMEVKGDLPYDFDVNSSPRPLPPDYVPSDLSEIPKAYSLRKGLKLRRDALEKLIDMIEDAKAEGLIIRVVSAYRSWRYQRWLYERAIERYGPDQRLVAKPGRSEHQLGLAVDLVVEDLSLATDPGFKFTKEYRWLSKNAERYCFKQSYGPNSPYYEEEPWHFRFLGCGSPSSSDRPR